MHCYCVYFRKINAQKIFKKRWKSQPLVTKLQKMMMKSNVDVRKLSSLMKQAFAGRRIEQQFLCCRAKLNHIMHLSTPFPQKQKWFIVTARRLPISLYILCAAQRIPIRIYFAHNSAISQSIYIATIFKLRSTTEQMPPLVFIHTQERCTATHCGFKPSLNCSKIRTTNYVCRISGRNTWHPNPKSWAMALVEISNTKSNFQILM
jgi:hypothetical protein